MRSLSAKALDFWQVSCSWNKRHPEGVSYSFSRAMKILNDARDETGSHRKLAQSVDKLKHEMIHGEHAGDATMEHEPQLLQMEQDPK